jgi:predicted nucleotidyltransferase
MPTVLELKREEWQPYIGAASRRVLDKTLTPDERQVRERLLAQVREAAEALKRRFGVRRVILFGSLAHEAWFTSGSDVDLAVDGLAAADFWAAWRVAEEIIGDRLVDLVEIEAANEGLRNAIERHGVEL